MIRTISLLFVTSTLFFSSNIRAGWNEYLGLGEFDAEVLSKAKELLEKKQIKRDIQKELYPDVQKYAQQKVINGQQYLEDNREKLFIQHEKLLTSYVKVDRFWASMFIIVGCIGVEALFRAQVPYAPMVPAIVAAMGGYFLFNPQSKEKNKALVIILDKKISEVEARIKKYKDILDSKDSKAIKE
jgi:hypothetical protein